MKYCSKCQQSKLTSKFYKDKSATDGLTRYCRQCHQQYYQENKDRIKAYSKKYAQKNREKYLEYHRSYHQKNKKKMNKKNLEYYYQKKEKQAAGI